MRWALSFVQRRQPYREYAMRGWAQIVPKICQRYQNISNNIEVYRNPGALKNTLFTE